MLDPRGQVELMCLHIGVNYWLLWAKVGLLLAPVCFHAFVVAPRSHFFDEVHVARERRVLASALRLALNGKSLGPNLRRRPLFSSETFSVEQWVDHFVCLVIEPLLLLLCVVVGPCRSRNVVRLPFVIQQQCRPCCRKATARSARHCAFVGGDTCLAACRQGLGILPWPLIMPQEQHDNHACFVVK